MIYPALVTVLALLMYISFLINVGRARGKYKVMAPAMSGHIEFEKRLRIQINTLEHLIVFIPALWLFGFFWPYSGEFLGVNWIGPHISALVGMVWLGARFAYATAYCRNPEKRYTAVILSIVCLILLTLGALTGILSLLYQHFN